MSRSGIDYSAYSAIDVDAMWSAGVSFVVRYLSHDHRKNLSPGEAQILSGGGIDIAVVWESSAQRALGGHAAGEADARDAVMQAAACGMPEGRPIYFAVDFDAKDEDKPIIAEYLGGAASALGLERVGVYGGYWVVRYCFDHEAAAWGWQTYAWSGGRREVRAHIYQRLNGVKIAGISCDLDTALQLDFGQWRCAVEEPSFPFPAGEYIGASRPDHHCHWGATAAERHAIAQWQAHMRQRGWALPATGVFARQSHRVCSAFQAEKGLTVDGLVGPKTWTATWSAPVTLELAGVVATDEL